MGLMRDSWKRLKPGTRMAIVLGPAILVAILGFLPGSIQIQAVLAIVVVFGTIMFIIHNHLYQQREEIAIREYRQVESLLALSARLNGLKDIRGLRTYAASPDMLNHVLDLVERHSPRVIMELGSGVSTRILNTYLLSSDLNVNFYSVEHDAGFLEVTKTSLKDQGVRLIHAPLTPITMDGQTYQWYDPEMIHPDEPIDLLIVDGPPETLNPQARYPAFPILKDRLSANAVIVMDDAGRPDEQAIIQRWLRLEPMFKVEELAEKGLAVLYRKSEGHQ